MLEVALAQNGRVHPKINAVSRLMEKEARARLAGPLSGPFAGVPFLIKDIAHDYVGLPTTQGSRSMLSAVPNEHAGVVRRYLDAVWPRSVGAADTRASSIGMAAATAPAVTPLATVASTAATGSGADVANAMGANEGTPDIAASMPVRSTPSTATLRSDDRGSPVMQSGKLGENLGAQYKLIGSDGVTLSGGG